MSFFSKTNRNGDSLWIWGSYKIIEAKGCFHSKILGKTGKIKIFSLIARLQDNQFNELLKLCLKIFQSAWKLVVLILSYYQTPPSAWIKMTTEAESDSRQRVSPWLLGCAGRCCGSGGLAPDSASEALYWLMCPEPRECTSGTAYL